MFTVCNTVNLFKHCYALQNSSYYALQRIWLVTMSNVDDLEQFKKDFESLIGDLNDIYYAKTCDVFAQAKSALTKSTEELLGEEYRALCDELKSIKDTVANMQGDFQADEDLLKHKAHLEALKFKIAHAETEQEKLLHKAEMSKVLSDIAQITRNNFGLVSSYKKKIDSLIERITNLYNDKKATIKANEEKIIADARSEIAQLVLQYKSQVSTLCSVYKIKDHPNDVPFLKSFDLNTRLIDFEKTSIGVKAARDPPCKGCDNTENCQNCQKPQPNIEDAKEKTKNYFNCTASDDTKN